MTAAPIVTFVAGWVIGRLQRQAKLDVQVRIGGENTYFPDGVNEEDVLNELTADSALDRVANMREVFARHGGTSELATVVVSFANPKKTPVNIVGLTTRVVGREPARFKVKHQPQYGGPVSVVHLAFDLDVRESPAVLVDPDSVHGLEPQTVGQRSFFDTQDLVLLATGEPLQVTAVLRATRSDRGSDRSGVRGDAGRGECTTMMAASGSGSTYRRGCDRSAG